MEPPAFQADPPEGRVYATERAVRGTDVTPAGRLRLDSLARYLQEAAEDDVADAGWDEPFDWLLRRCSVSMRRYPRRGERVKVRTFCSGLGPRWAERTTTVATGCGDAIQARALWVALSRESGAPAPLGPGFLRVYGPSARGRTVSARLGHPDPAAPAQRRAWPLRACDFDTAGHVNNTVHWAAVEDALTEIAWVPSAAEMEYHQPILPGHTPSLVTAQSPGLLSVWLVQQAGRLASARLRS